MQKAIFSLCVGALVLTGCSSESKDSASSTQAEATSTMTKLGPEFTAAYICPMHCEGSGSDKPGKCPVCDMDYRPNPDLAKPAGPDSTSK